MKRVALFLLLTSGTAAATPNGAWLEFYSGKLESEEALVNVAEDDGRMRGFAGALPIGAMAYLRGDWREELYEFRYAGNAETFELNRTVTALTIGMVDFGRPEYRMFGEIGAARIEWEQVMPGGTGLVSSATEATAPLFRLGLAGEDGRFSWYLVGEWVKDGLQADLTEDSERWWNAYLGYQLSQHLEIGVRYARADEFTGQLGASLRIRL